MNKELIKLSLIGTVIISLLAGALWYNDYKFKHKQLRYFTFEVNGTDYVVTDSASRPVGDFLFVNQKGEAVNQAYIGNSIYVADYIFTTCPGICKIMSKRLKKVHDEFSSVPNFKIISHTSKPEEDSVSVLMDYALANGIKNHDKWLFLTGKLDDLQRMAYEQYGILNPEDIEEDGFVHSEMLVLVDANKYIRGYYDGTDSLEVETLINDIYSLLNE